MADFQTGFNQGILQLSMQVASQNQAGNFSTINWQLYLISYNGTSWNADPTGWSANVAGVGYSGTYTFDFRHETYHLIAATSVNAGHDANGYCNVTGYGHTNYTGTSAIGGPADVSGTMALPRIPKPPGAPGIKVASVVGRTVNITVTAPADNGGASISAYVVQYSKDGGAWTGNQYGGSTTYTNLLPGSYVFRTQAANSAGSGAFAQTPAVQVRAGGRIKIGGTMQPLTPKIKIGGTMQPLTLKAKIGGTMVPIN